MPSAPSFFTKSMPKNRPGLGGQSYKHCMHEKYTKIKLKEFSDLRDQTCSIFPLWTWMWTKCVQNLYTWHRGTVHGALQEYVDLETPNLTAYFMKQILKKMIFPSLIYVLL